MVEKINGSMENLLESMFAVLSVRVGDRRSLWELSEDGAVPGGALSMWCAHSLAMSSLALLSLSLSITTR